MLITEISSINERKNTTIPERRSSDKLRLLYGTDRKYVGLQAKNPEKTPDPDRGILEDRRNVYALRVHKGISDKILKHKNAREIFVFLELKPLFISSVIFSENGNYPYKKISLFLREGLSTTRKKIAILRKLKLARFDKNKNLVLSNYSRVLEILKIEKNFTTIKFDRERGKNFEIKTYKRKKYKVLNNGGTQFAIKQIAIFENLNKQKHRVIKKIISKELQQMIIDRNLDPQDSKSLPNFKDCEKTVSKSLVRRYKKFLLKDFDLLVAKYSKVYDAQSQQLAFDFPDLNPRVTLSCNGIAKVLNRKSKSSGYYQSRKLVNAGLMTTERNYKTIENQSPAIYESMYGIRSDVFGYYYPTRDTNSGRVKKYFVNLPNTIRTNEKTLFF